MTIYSDVLSAALGLLALAGLILLFVEICRQVRRQEARADKLARLIDVYEDVFKKATR